MARPSTKNDDRRCWLGPHHGETVKAREGAKWVNFPNPSGLTFMSSFVYKVHEGNFFYVPSLN